jgi:tetratricopeptide (TPR) repeat protein
MSRWQIAAGLFVAVSGLAVAQTSQDPVQDNPNPYGLPPPFKAAPVPEKSETRPEKAETPLDKSQMPPEEDKTDAPRAFSFNPVQSQREVTAGLFYFKKGNYIAAASRFDEATKWNEGNAEAWLRLGEAQEKKSNAKAAREAYEKYLQLAPDARDAAEIKKKLEKLKG